MGVRGLTAFIDINSKTLLTDHRLHHTKLIIDGNNLYHFIYYSFKIPHEYGGDYELFYEKCAAFFNTLAQCHIKPFVIFDGAYAADGNKFKTSMERARDRIRVSGVLATGSMNGKLLPILTHDAFCCTLMRLHVPHVTCDFEADQQVAALARRWNCPVLTNDSDFFVYDISAGVILLDYFDFSMKRNKSDTSKSTRMTADCSAESCPYFTCQIFYISNLMKLLRVKDHSLIVLLATLLGNDLVDGRLFDDFFARAKLSKSAVKKMAGKRQVKIASAIGWLQSVHSVKEAVAVVLAQLAHDKQASTAVLVQQSLDTYSNLDTDLDSYFDTPASAFPSVTSRCEDGVRVVGQSAVVTPDGTQLPAWFTQCIRSCQIPVALLNVLANRRLLLLCQIENMKETSTYDCAQLLRSIAYGILLSVGGQSSEQTQRRSVEEFTREHKIMKHATVEAVFQVNDQPVPCLSCVLELDESDRLQFLMAAMSCSSVAADATDDVDNFSCQVQFLVKVVQYWALNATPRLTVLHVNAVLLCLVKLGALDSVFLSNSVSVETAKADISDPRPAAAATTAAVECDSNMDAADSVDGVWERAAAGHHSTSDKICQQLLQRAKSHLDRLSVVPKHNNAAVFDIAAVHAFAQFQACLQAAIYLTRILFLHELIFDPAVVFSGTVMYNALRQLRSHSNHETFISDQLGTLYSKYQCIVLTVCCQLPDTCLEPLNLVARRNNKKSKKKKPAAGSSDTASNLIEMAALSESTNEILVANCDIKNKFGCLLAADN